MMNFPLKQIVLYADKIDQNRVFVLTLVCNDPEKELKAVPSEI